MDNTNKTIIGQKFGKLLITGFGSKPNTIICQCDCGDIREYIKGNVLYGRSKGCVHCRCKKDYSVSKEPLWQRWYSMRNKCDNESIKIYKRFGALGIKYYEPWTDFFVFKKWANENGFDENDENKKFLCRYDIDKDFTPENCYWGNRLDAYKKTRGTVGLTYKGVEHNLNTWAKILNTTRQAIDTRIRLGYSPEQIVEIPYDKTRHKVMSQYIKKEDNILIYKRKELHYTINDASKKLKMSNTSYSKKESKKSRIKETEIEKIFKKLNFTEEEKEIFFEQFGTNIKYLKSKYYKKKK